MESLYQLCIIVSSKINMYISMFNMYFSNGFVFIKDNLINLISYNNSNYTSLNNDLNIIHDEYSYDIGLLLKQDSIDLAKKRLNH